MKTLILFILFLGWINPADSDTCTTNPVAVGSRATLTLTVPKSDVIDGQLKWKLGRFDALECDIDKNPPCAPSQLVIGLTGTMEPSGSSNYRITLTITTVSRSRDERTWKVTSAGKEIKTCDLKVYSFPSNPVCEGFGMPTDGKHVVWTCTVEDVYPDIMDCRFMFMKGGTQNAMVPITQGVDKQTSEISSSYKYTCTLSLPLNQLAGEGSYTFRFQASMVWQGSDLVGKTGDDKELTLEFPRVQLEASCPRGYISEKDTSKTCGCRRTSPGIPAGIVLWVNDNGQPVGNDINSDDVRLLPLIYDSKKRHPTYTCRGFTDLGEGPGVTYSPQFAYGPSAIGMTLHDASGTVTKCDADNSFWAYCDVAVGDATPKPTMRLEASDGSTISLTKDATEGGFYRFKYNVVPDKGGNLELTCLASNPEFPNDLKAETMKTIRVLVPPPSRPVMTVEGRPPVENGGVATVIDGDEVKVKCRADGGYPVVNRVTMTCGGLVNVNAGKPEAAQTLYVRKDDNNQKCTCKAEHESGCYDYDESEFTLNVLYGPSQVSMSLHDNSGTVKKCAADASFSAYCEVAKDNANPTPTIMLTVDDDSTIVSKWTSIVNKNYRNTYTVTPGKGGVLTMTCLATNPSVSRFKTEKTKTITVLVPPPSRPVMTVNGGPPVPYEGVATVTDGDEVKVSCRADGGYPPVNRVTTTCAGLTNVNDGASEATQTLYVRKEYNNLKCTCKAEHESGCYDDGESEFTLNVRYTPTMTSFEADKKSTKLTVSADDNVKFVCEAEGNPTPIVSVKGQRWGGIITLQDTPSGLYSRESTGTKKMTCQDTDLYTCTAHNGVGSAGTTRTISLFVECVPELPPGSDSSIQEYSYLNGTDMEIQIPIIGYPPPENFSLKKITNTRRRKRATEEEEISKEMYITTYEAGPAPKGTVSLTLIGLTSRYSGQYVLIIDNGIGQGLDYTFNVTVVSASRPNETTSSGLETSTVIGVVIAFLLGVVLTILGFFLWMKARKRRSRGATKNEQDPSNGQARFGQHQPSPQHRHQERPLEDYDVANAQESQQGASGRNKYWRIVLGGAPGEENAATVTAAISSLPPSTPHNLVSSEGVYEECDIYDELDSEFPVEPTVTPPVNHGVYENNPSLPSTTAAPEGDGGPKPQEYDYDYLLPQSPPSTTAEPDIIGQPTTLEDCDGYVITHPQSLPPKKSQGTIVINNGDNASKDSTYNNVGNNNYSNVDIVGKARQGVNGEPAPLEHIGGSRNPISPPTARAHSEGLGKPTPPEVNGGHPLPLTTPMQSQPTIDIKSGDNTPNASVYKNVGNKNYYNVDIADKA